MPTHNPASKTWASLLAGVSLAAVCTAAPAVAQQAQPAGVQEIIVTAQKREQSINKVAMSITAASAERLSDLGVTSAAELGKVVPGFNFNVTAFGTPVYTIRGVGFQEATLSATPAVTVYTDEVPIPFPAMTNGVVFDIERVEVLKGPQGTLYGNNSTGGAVNYITAKPTDSIEAGGELSYGRFNTADLQGYISGPLADGLKARLAVRLLNSDDWQKSYTRNDEMGEQHLLQGRATIEWEPSDRLRASFVASGWVDKSDTPSPQFIANALLSGPNPLPPEQLNYPRAPANARAADWDPGRDYKRNNRFYQFTGRMDYDLSDDVTTTLLGTYEHFKRDQPREGDGTSFDNLFILNTGRISTYYLEARLAGNFSGRGSWIVGVNYQNDDTFDQFFQSFTESTNNLVAGLPLGEGLANRTDQKVKTYAAFAAVEYPLTDTMSLEGGIRYTKADRDLRACNFDTGNGQAAALFTLLENVFKNFPDPAPPPIEVGQCYTFNSVTLDPGPVFDQLNQDNISWRAGVNWQATPETLLYANVSRGYKSGSFPTLGGTYDIQFNPVTQETVLAYEAGFKTALAGNTLQLTGAAFYYDYKNKQIRGRLIDQTFGPLEALVNVPKSHVIGAELSAVWRPTPEITISPSATYIKSEIDGEFFNYTTLGNPGNFSGEAFPYTPKWQTNVDAEYRWGVGRGVSAFVGGNLSYQSRTNGGLGEDPLLDIKGYTLLDLRAGVSSDDGAWKAMLWGRNVTNTYYWNTAARFNDTVFRYAGMPVTYGITLAYKFR